MVTCTRRIQFCAGHRVHKHESKCANFHGHNYVALFEAVAPELDGIGRVIDFSVLKDRIGGWIDRYWDHGFIFWEHDREARNALLMLPDQKLYAMPTNPTAENMALYLLNNICPELLTQTGIVIKRVVVHETENCYAEATKEGDHG